MLSSSCEGSLRCPRDGQWSGFPVTVPLQRPSASANGSLSVQSRPRVASVAKAPPNGLARAEPETQGG